MNFRAAEPWEGIFPAALTMFTRSGDLDEHATAEHVAQLVERGAAGVVVGGTSGEFIGLGESERFRLIELTVDAAGSNVPVIAGTGYYSTAATIRLTRYAEQIGASGCIVILPYYQRPHRAEIVEHFVSVSASSDLPIMIYNNPGNSAAGALDSSTVAELAAAGHAAAVKSTLPTVNEIHELRTLAPASFRVFYGSFAAPLEAFAGGAHGWISGILNVVLEDATALWGAVTGANLSAARAIWQERILPIKRLYTESILGPASDLAIYRGILRLRGDHAGYCRAPLSDLSGEQLRALERYLLGSRLDGGFPHPY